MPVSTPYVSPDAEHFLKTGKSKGPATFLHNKLLWSKFAGPFTRDVAATLAHLKHTTQGIDSPINLRASVGYLELAFFIRAHPDRFAPADIKKSARVLKSHAKFQKKD